MENSINKINDFKTENNNENFLGKNTVNDLAIDNIDDSLYNVDNKIENNQNNTIENNISISENISEENKAVLTPQSNNNTSIQDIENIILDDGIKEIYDKMDSKKQQKFEKELNKTSNKIHKLVEKFKNNLSKAIIKIFILIKKLLSKAGYMDDGYVEKTIKIKIENIIKLEKNK